MGKNYHRLRSEVNQKLYLCCAAGPAGTSPSRETRCANRGWEPGCRCRHYRAHSPVTAASRLLNCPTIGSTVVGQWGMLSAAPPYPLGQSPWRPETLRSPILSLLSPCGDRSRRSGARCTSPTESGRHAALRFAGANTAVVMIIAATPTKTVMPAPTAASKSAHPNRVPIWPAATGEMKP